MNNKANTLHEDPMETNLYNHWYDQAASSLDHHFMCPCAICQVMSDREKLGAFDTVTMPVSRLFVSVEHPCDKYGCALLNWR